MAIQLDLTSFANAQERLAEALQALKGDSDNTLYRDATIQRFEFTYELAHKMLRRYMEMEAASAETIDLLSFPNLIRTGWEQGLLRNSWDRWHRYREARGTTSHTYDADKALMVLAIVPDFLEEARYLLQVLRKRGEAR